jgi:predicted DNA binding CopG/RHH family protein
VGNQTTRIKESAAEYYDRSGVLTELREEPVEFSLNEELRREILEGKRKRRLRNISIKIDPMQIQALKKIATMKSIPYQTLIRQWLSECIRKELHIRP